MLVIPSHDDPILDALIDQAAQDSETIGLILSGSRGAGCADDSSDYDLLWILTDQEYDEREAPVLQGGVATRQIGQSRWCWKKNRFPSSTRPR